MRTYFGEGWGRLITRIEKGWAEERAAPKCWRSIGKRFLREALTTPSWNLRPPEINFPFVPCRCPWPARSGASASLIPVLVLMMRATGQGLVTHLDSKNCVCVNEDQHHRITTIGCEDLVVVHTPEPASCAPEMKQQVKELATSCRRKNAERTCAGY